MQFSFLWRRTFAWCVHTNLKNGKHRPHSWLGVRSIFTLSAFMFTCYAFSVWRCRWVFPFPWFCCSPAAFGLLSPVSDFTCFDLVHVNKYQEVQTLILISDSLIYSLLKTISSSTENNIFSPLFASSTGFYPLNGALLDLHMLAADVWVPLWPHNRVHKCFTTVQGLVFNCFCVNHTLTLITYSPFAALRSPLGLYHYRNTFSLGLQIRKEKERNSSKNWLFRVKITERNSSRQFERLCWLTACARVSFWRMSPPEVNSAVWKCL